MIDTKEKHINNNHRIYNQTGFEIWLFTLETLSHIELVHLILWNKSYFCSCLTSLYIYALLGLITGLIKNNQSTQLPVRHISRFPWQFPSHFSAHVIKSQMIKKEHLIATRLLQGNWDFSKIECCNRNILTLECWINLREKTINLEH